MALFFDFEPLPTAITNGALEFICKAGSEPDDDSIWREHESPFLRRLVEVFTQRGLHAIRGAREALTSWLSGKHHVPGDAPPPPDDVRMGRWSDERLALTRAYLEAKPPGEYGIDDYMLLVDYVFQRYLPPDFARSEAEWMAVRSAMMGRVEAAMARATETQAATLFAAMPNTVAEAVSTVDTPEIQRTIMEYGRARCSEAITNLTSVGRARIKSEILAHQEAAMGGVSGPALESKLFDQFAIMNRDWRRIALTEAAENSNQGFVAAQPAGTKIKRSEHYVGACPFCRKIDGVVVTVVAPGKADKDGDTEVWPGKTNIGRSAAPRMRVGGRLVERPADQRWWIAAGAQHPHCRGRWLPLPRAKPGVDQDFTRWMNERLEKRK